METKTLIQEAHTTIEQTMSLREEADIQRMGQTRLLREHIQQHTHKRKRRRKININVDKTKTLIQEAHTTIEQRMSLREEPHTMGYVS